MKNFIIAILSIILTNISYSWNIDISYPSSECYTQPTPILFYSPPLQFQCNFKISGYFWDPAQYEYKVNFLYNNILSPDLTSVYANKNEDQSVTLTINTLNGPCLNRYSKVVVFARPLEGDWDYAYKYFTAFYYSDINC